MSACSTRMRRQPTTIRTMEADVIALLDFLAARDPSVVGQVSLRLNNSDECNKGR